MVSLINSILNMKKFALIAFSIFYLTIISGVNLNMHYCGGKLINISFTQASNDGGCCGAKKSTKGCCHDHSTILKLKEKHVQSSDIKIDFELTDLNFLPAEYSKTIEFTRTKSEIVLNYHAPPPNYNIPLFLKNRVLII